MDGYAVSQDLERRAEIQRGIIRPVRAPPWNYKRSSPQTRVASLVLTALFAVASYADSQSIAAQKPAVSIRWTAIPVLQRASQNREPSEARLVFLDDNHVVVGALFETYPDSRTPDFRSLVKGDAAVAVVDLSTAETAAARNWSGLVGVPAFGERLLLGATSTADVIVGAGDRLYLLTGTLKALNDRVLPLNKVVRNGTSFQNGWDLAMSSHRDAALLIGSGPDLPLVAHWIDLDTLADTAVMPIANPDKVTVLSRSTVAFNPHSITDFAVHVQSMGEQPHVLCAECSDSAVLTGFGSGLLLIATKPDGAYLVTTASGEVLMRDTQGARNSHLQNGVGAVTANRAAFVRANPIGPITLTSSDEIVVLDSDAKHVMWQYDVQQQPKPVDDWVHFRAPEIALSPDGHKIAILSGEQLEIFNID